MHRHLGGIDNVAFSTYDELDYIGALESVRATLTEEKRAGAVDFFIGNDLNIDLKLDSQGLDSIEWYGMYGPSAKEAVRILLLMRKVPIIAGLHRDQHLDEQRR